MSISGGSADRDLALRNLNVSRETLERLDVYAALLAKWTPKINLIARSTQNQIWSRHIVDSLQVADHFEPTDQIYCDFGSGAGLPGLVLAAVLAETQPQIQTVLVESDQRKSAFLVTAAKEMGLSVQIPVRRIEDMPPFGADVISARALAGLDKLLGLCVPHLADRGRCLLLKGAAYRQELDEALENWRFDSEQWPSTTNPQGVLLQLRNIQHV